MREQDNLNSEPVRAVTEPTLDSDGYGLFLRVELSGSRRRARRVAINGKRRNPGLGGGCPAHAGIDLVQAARRCCCPV